MADLGKTQFRALGLALCIVPFLVLAFFFWGGGSDAEGGDYAQYLLHARAVLEGRSYTDIGYIYSERNPVIGPRAYSPGLPLTLAAASYLFGWNDAAHLIVPFLGALAFLLIVGLYFKEIEGSALAPLVVLVCGLAPGLARTATLVGSDVVFCALAWAVIYLIDSKSERHRAQLVMVR